MEGGKKFLTFLLVAVLHREHTIANGDRICDYWVTGDRAEDAK